MASSNTVAPDGWTFSAEESFNNLMQYLDDNVHNNVQSFTIPMLQKMAEGMVHWSRAVGIVAHNLYPKTWKKEQLKAILSGVREIFPCINAEKPKYIVEEKHSVESRIEVGRLKMDAWTVRKAKGAAAANMIRCAGFEAAEASGLNANCPPHRKLGSIVYMAPMFQASPQTDYAQSYYVFKDKNGGFVPSTCVGFFSPDGSNAVDAHAQLQGWIDEHAKTWVPKSNRAYLRYWLAAKALEVAVGKDNAAQLLADDADYILIATNDNLANMIQDTRPMGERAHAHNKRWNEQYEAKRAQYRADVEMT